VSDLAITTVAHNVPWAIREQIRLFSYHVRDDYELVVVDNSTDPGASGEIRDICSETGTTYLRVPGHRHEHPDALNSAIPWLLECTTIPFVGAVDHDVFPRAPTRIIPLIKPAGFFGIAQTHLPTLSRYIKPSFAFFDRAWLNGRVPDFEGIRAADKADDGDCASMLAPLFSTEDWARLPVIEHGYEQVRDEDESGMQSSMVEVFGPRSEWVHLFNLSRWLSVPDPDGREALVREMVEAM
jgi:hypothetical protein